MTRKTAANVKKTFAVAMKIYRQGIAIAQKIFVIVKMTTRLIYAAAMNVIAKQTTCQKIVIVQNIFVIVKRI